MMTSLTMSGTQIHIGDSGRRQRGQSGHGPEQRTPYELAERCHAYAIRRPVVNGEPCYEGHGKGRTLTRFRAYDVRKATWQNLFPGHGGHHLWRARHLVVPLDGDGLCTAAVEIRAPC